MPKWNQGTYQPNNPKKYIGDHKPIFRSSWELSLMRWCDGHPDVINWGSECVKIPYWNPFKNKVSTYVPDFLIVYRDKNGNQKAEVIEVKPKKEVTMETARTEHDKMSVILNTSKWESAQQYCKKNGLTFRVVTEEQLFRKPPQPKKRGRKKRK